MRALEVAQEKPALEIQIDKQPMEDIRLDFKQTIIARLKTVINDDNLNKHGVFTDEDLNMVFKVDKPDMQPHWCYNIDASDLEMRLLQHAIATDVDPKNPVIEFYLNNLHDKFTVPGRDFIKRILAQSMLKNLNFQNLKNF